jgi:hypothetical protein
MEESLSSKHSNKLFMNSLKHFLNCGGVSNKSSRHLQSLWRNVANAGFDVVGNPFNKVGTIFVLNVEHLLVNFLRGNPSSEESGGS